MEKLEGRLKELYIESVRDDLKSYARYADKSARDTEVYATELALEAEALNDNADPTGVSFEDMSPEYETRKDDFGNHLLIKVDPCDNGAFLSLASGCQRVPLTPEVMQQLKNYERMKPNMMRMYDEVENIDGVFLFDTRTNTSLFRTEYMFPGDILPGVDVAAFYDIGLTFYDWFRSADKKNNPDRRALWSEIAFIAIEHDWIMNLQAPIFNKRYSENEEMIGVIAVHFNLDWLVTNTIGKSSIKMMVVKDDATLVGLNRSAKTDVRLETYDKSSYISYNGFDPATTRKKKTFVYETLNLDYEKSEDVASFSMKLKSEFQFSHTLFGKTYTVLRERAPELGLNFIALLEDV
jgi:hypothetical protein